MVQVLVPLFRMVQLCVNAAPACSVVPSAMALDTNVAPSTRAWGTTICTVMASPKGVPVPLVAAACIRHVAV